MDSNRNTINRLSTTGNKDPGQARTEIKKTLEIQRQKKESVLKDI